MSHLFRMFGAFGLTTVLLLSVAGNAAADGHMVTGSGAGNLGGAQMQWNTTLPANTDASMTIGFWPCINPGAIQLDVYGASGLAGSAGQDGPCTKSLSWNTGEGGDVLVQFTNYLHGVGTHWTITTEGFSLGEGAGMMAETDDAMMADDGAEAMADDAEMADDAAMADEAMADEAMAEEDGEEMMAEGDGEMMAAAAEMAPKAAMVGEQEMAGTLVGDIGGAFTTYDMPVSAGQTYNLRMTRGMGVGGNWPGVGFKVWGTNGLVTRSMATYGDPATATFTADADGTYQVQVYNYHHGQTLFYAFDMPSSDDS